LKYHLWYLCQISLQIMLLPILITEKINRINEVLELLVSVEGL